MAGALEALITRESLVTDEALGRARLVQAETGERLDSVLTRLGLIPERDLAAALAKATRLDLVDADAFPAEPVAADRLAPRFLRDVKALPLSETDTVAEIAVVNPLDGFSLRALGMALGKPVHARIAKAGDVEAALDRLYPAVVAADGAGDFADEADVERLRDMASDAPVVRAVNALIARAAETGASDIHIEPAEDSLIVRFRIDGVLHDEPSLPVQFKAALISRIKVMAGLNIAERRLPQDGRIRQSVRGHEIDLRVATSPLIHGEAVVMRLLDRSNLALDFGALGFADASLAAFRKLLHQPHGILLVTGPTGSGKTTTLYAALSELNSRQRKILTIEDPIEYRLAGVNQMQVAPQIGLTFAAALRSFLRQDPDMMMVGEIRDLETAQVAVQAALTGHGILSTLHTNSAAAAVTRLIDMGVEPFLITSTLNGVLAQRLVRRLCQQCRTPKSATADVLTSAGLGGAGERDITLCQPVGCAACGQSGFAGRIAILELLTVDETVSSLIVNRADASEIQKAALAAGMVSMLADGAAKARAGLTTLEEVLRVTTEA